MKIWFQTKRPPYPLWEQTRVQLAALSAGTPPAYTPLFSSAEPCVSPYPRGGSAVPGRARGTPGVPPAGATGFSSRRPPACTPMCNNPAATDQGPFPEQKLVSALLFGGFLFVWFLACAWIEVEFIGPRPSAAASAMGSGLRRWKAGTYTASGRLPFLKSHVSFFLRGGQISGHGQDQTADPFQPVKRKSTVEEAFVLN